MNSRGRSAPVLLALCFAGLLSACTSGGEVGAAESAVLAGRVVMGDGPFPRAGAAVTLVRAGDRRVQGSAVTDAAGRFSFAGLAEGRYDLTVRADGAAGTDVSGLTAREGSAETYIVPEGAALLPGTDGTPPSLVVSRADTGAVLTPDAPTVFASRVSVRARTVVDSGHVRPLRSFRARLLTVGADGAWTPVQPDVTVTADPQQDPADSGTLTLNAGSVGGAAVLEVSATDFAGSRALTYLPVQLPAATGGAVTAPQDVRAVAYTWVRGQEPHLSVRLSWSVPDVGGVAGFEVWRATAGSGWARVLVVTPDRCSGSLCVADDDTPGLTDGQDVQYRVTAVGANTAQSAVAVTHPLPPFGPDLLRPAAGADGVDVRPVYAVHLPARVAGATGVVTTLSVEDDLLGASTLWSQTLQVRTVNGQAGQAAGTPDHQVLVLGSGGYAAAYSDLFPAGNVPGVTYDSVSEVLSVTHGFAGSGAALQPNRRVRWTLGRTLAFRVLDPSVPPGALNPVVAYSVFRDPSGSDALTCPARPVLPSGTCLEAGPSAEFTTGSAQ